MFWLLPVQSEVTLSALGWAIMSIIIAGISGCWICVVVKKMMFIFCERKQLSASKAEKQIKETAKTENRQTTEFRMQTEIAIDRSTMQTKEDVEKEEVKKNVRRKEKVKKVSQKLKDYGKKESKKENNKDKEQAQEVEYDDIDEDLLDAKEIEELEKEAKAQEMIGTRKPQAS